ncbi:MCP four helix bundle domain-containing protein, partial [Longimicrobium sp.]|uniref:MCP four helix bundle domain-containing protein n=1 Tax=Longimicrobium sp. TaxID=2029185 RepID=UPI002E3441CB
MLTWFNDLKIRAKLLVGFGVVALATVLVGVASIRTVSRMAAADEQLYAQNTRGVAIATEIKARFQEVRVNLFKFGGSATAESDARVAERLRVHTVAVDSLLDAYRGTLVSAQDTALYTEAKEKINAFKPIAERVSTLYRAGSDEAAYALLMGDGAAASDGVEEALVTLDEFNDSAARATSQANAALAASARRFIAGLLLASVAAALLIGWAISGRVSRAVERVARTTESLRAICVTNLGLATRAMAVGDLDRQIPTGTTLLEVDSKDELGQLADTVNGMIRETQATVAAFDSARDTLRGVVVETNGLVQAASEGRLGERGRADVYQGSYRALVDGVNRTLDAVVAPVNESSAVLRRLADGDFTARVNGEYRGDYAVIKDSVNRMADS